MDKTAILIFAITYAGVALGEIPGLALDRTGVALLGAIAMVVSGVLSPHAAVSSVDVPTILLLYALMIISAQFRLSGFYTRTAMAIVRFVRRPRIFLAVLMGTSALLSTVLANDIVCLAFTPVVCLALLEANMNPVPFLISLAIASNIGSAATIIGNPQNMLLGQLGNLHFGQFTLYCCLPALASLAAAYGVLLLLYRTTFSLSYVPRTKERRQSWPSYNAHQTRKGAAIVALLIILFFSPVPRELAAIGLAGVLLCSRETHTRSILGLVDWHLITLFCALFIVVAGIEKTGLPLQATRMLRERGFAMTGLVNLTLLSTVLSNIVSNVPATMLIIKFLNAADPRQWYVVALSSTLAGNCITIGSIATLIVIESAKAYGITIGFREHARAGLPVTLLSILITLAWIAW